MANWKNESVKVVNVLSITFLMDKNKEIKRIYGIDHRNLHTPRNGGLGGQNGILSEPAETECRSDAGRRPVLCGQSEARAKRA